METTDISKLALVLRNNGAEVLNGLSKLTLSSDLLNDLNNSFSEVIDQRDVMNSSFHVINNSNSKLEVFRDLQFLHDFVQRASSLKLTPSNIKYEFTDITKFKNLKLLEVSKLKIKTIHGIQPLRTQLQYLICTRSLSSLSEILEKCGGDDSSGLKWVDLKEAIFNHNYLQSIDNSLEFAPFLHTLDLSHNEINNADAINCLPNLKQLNLGYNKLASVPAFSGQLCNRLQNLVLRNNFIEDINEISILSNLCELDLSENCLIEHNSLIPLANLATLQWLSLKGNPLSFHPQHRTKSASCLHDNTGTVRFVLDHMVLSKSEQKLVGSLHPRVLLRPTSTTSCEVAVEKPKRIRNVSISNIEHSPIMDSSLASISSLITSGEHLETKRQIEQLHEQYGDKWLHSQAGSLVQDVLGLEKSPIPLSSTPYGVVEVLIQAELHAEQYSQKDNEVENKTETFVTASETLLVDNGLYENAVEEIVSESPSEDEDLGNGEENIFLATIKGETDPVFIVISKTHILERECTSTKERARWPIETLTICESNESYLQLHFDTLKNDKKQRQYTLEKEDSDNLQRILKKFIDNRPTDEKNFTVFKCLKCSTQFGVEKSKRLYDNEQAECPACESQLVFEDDS